MKVVIESRRRSREAIERQYPGAVIVDVTSRGDEPWNRFSPFYPHGGIPVPFSPGVFAASVEGIWQGLKVFENAGIDLRKLENTTGKDLKRTTRRFGPVLGHRKGVASPELLPYVEARKLLYVPAYEWVLEHRLAELLAELARLAAERTLVLLDYETNCDLDDPSRPLSHASLVRRRLLGAASGGSGAMAGHVGGRGGEGRSGAD